MASILVSSATSSQPANAVQEESSLDQKLFSMLWMEIKKYARPGVSIFLEHFFHHPHFYLAGIESEALVGLMGQLLDKGRANVFPKEVDRRIVDTVYQIIQSNKLWEETL